MPHTHADTMEPLAFLQEAIKFPHLAHARLRPTLGGDNGLDLLSERLLVFWLSRKVVENMGNTLLE